MKRRIFFNYEKRELNTPENYLFYTPRAPISDLGEFLISIDFTINYPRTKWTRKSLNLFIIIINCNVKYLNIKNYWPIYHQAIFFQPLYTPACWGSKVMTRRSWSIWGMFTWWRLMSCWTWPMSRTGLRPSTWSTREVQGKLKITEIYKSYNSILFSSNSRTKSQSNFKLPDSILKSTFPTPFTTPNEPLMSACCVCV